MWGGAGCLEGRAQEAAPVRAPADTLLAPSLLTREETPGGVGGTKLVVLFSDTGNKHQRGGSISDFAGRGGQSSFEGDPSAVPSESGSISLDLRALLWQWGGVQPVPAVCSSQAGFRACWYPSHLWV